MESIHKDMTRLMGEFLESSLASLKDLANGSRFAVALWKLNREQFPFYDVNSEMCISHKKAAEGMTMLDYRADNRRVWVNILTCIAAVAIEGWPDYVQEFQTKFLDRAIDGETEALEYLWLFFFTFVRDANFLAFRKFETRYNEISERIKEVIQESPSNTSESRKNQQSNSTGKYLAMVTKSKNFSASPERTSQNFVFDQEYFAPEKRVQELVQLVNDRDVEIQILREDLLFKEKENNDLKGKLGGLKADKKTLQEELQEKERRVSCLAFKVETLEAATDKSSDKAEIMHLMLAQAKIEDLYAEIDGLQKKNAYLQRRIDDLQMTKSMPTEEHQSEADDRGKALLKTLAMENDLVKGKLKTLEQNTDALSSKLLKEKDVSAKLAEQIQELHKSMTQKEIAIKGLANEKESLLKDNQHLREVIIIKDSQFKGLEIDYSRSVNSSEHAKGQRQDSDRKPAEDGNLELVKVCKEVNRYYKEEIMCLYNLFHDTFVNQLTGTTLDDLIKKRLAEAGRLRAMN